MNHTNPMMVAIFVALGVMLAIGSGIKGSFADTSQVALTGNGCVQNDCPGASSHSPGNFPKIAQGDCETLGKSVDGGCNGANNAPGQIAKNPICSPDNGATFGCTANEITPGQLNK